MKRASTILAIMLIFVSACPLGPKSEETDDVADETEPAPGPATEPSPASTSTSTSTDDGGITCEDELARTRAALADCQSSK